MDLVVRTPHGDADVTITRHGPDSTLGDLIAAVSGQAVPKVARVDDRTIDCATPLDAAGLLIGSIVTTDPEVPAPRHSEDVELVQIAGPGAGRSRPLSPGRYRVGPGRRSSADELSVAAVEEAAFEITVASDGSVTVGADAPGEGAIPAVCLAGSPVRSDTAWGDEVLTVANRAFVLDRRPPSDARHLPPPDPDGTVPFSRQPLRPGTPPRLPVIDAVRDATAIRPRLWQRRAGRPGAFLIPVGTREDPAGGVEVVEVDLDTERAVAVTGREAERTALARTLLVEATTALGPGDLDVVIATAPDRLAEWDWAKWLPHLRLDDGPTVLTAHDEIAAWADRSADPRTASPWRAAPWPPAHLTLLVVDDPNLWRRRESPLRSLLATPHEGLRVIALCDDTTMAPASCTTLISESPDRRWHLVSLTDRLDIEGVSAALVEPGLAAEVARALAPLADTELPEPVGEPEWASPRRSLLDCLGDPSPDDLVRRWADPDIDLTAVPLGTESVGLDLAAHDVVIAARDPREADRLAVTVAVAACTRLGPSALLLLDLVGAPSSVLAEFPHAVDGPATAADDALEPNRLIARIRHVLALEDAPQFVVVVVGATADRQLRNALLGASPDLPGLRLIVAATDAPGTEETTRITVERRGDRRRAVVDAPSGRTSVQLDDDPSDETDLILRPHVLGRALTPLEHRIEQRSQPTPLSFLAACRDLARRARTASGDVEHPWLIPASLPSSIDTDVLFAQWPGDAVPVGLVDVATTGQQPIWWQPDDGLLVAFGSLRSGVDDLLATVLLGMIDRIAPADVQLVVVDRSPARRQVIGTIDRRHLVVAPDESDDLLALLDVLETPRPPDQQLVVLIDDLGHLRARAAVSGMVDRLDQGLAAAGSVVAVARTADDAGPFLTAPGRHLVGSLAHRDDQRRLGGALDGARGRCRLLETGEFVQLASPDRSLTSMIPERLTGPQDGAR